MCGITKKYFNDFHAHSSGPKIFKFLNIRRKLRGKSEEVLGNPLE
jgi:hypothetical protein